MPAATLQTSSAVSNIVFGIAADANGLITTKISVNQKKDRKEVKNKFGDTYSVAYYNPTTEVSGEGQLTTGGGEVKTLGALVPAITTSIVGVAGATPVGKIFLDSIDFNFSQDDFVKVKWNGTAYDNIA